MVMDAVFCSSSSVQPRFEVLAAKKDELSAVPDSSSSTHPKEDPDILKEKRADRTVFVGNISSGCRRKHVRQLFKQHGCVESIRLRSFRGSSSDMSAKLSKKPYHLEDSIFNAYVVLSSSAAAEKCLALNGYLFHGRHLRVDLLMNKRETSVNQRSVFIGNLSFSADEERVREAFSVCGDIENVRIVRDPRTGIGKGFGFVTFVDPSGVVLALKQNNRVVVDKRTLRVTRSKDQTSLKVASQVKISGSTAIKGKKRRPDGSKNRYFRLPTVQSS